MNPRVDNQDTQGLRRHNDFRRVYGHQQAFVFGFAIAIQISGLALMAWPQPQGAG